MQSSEDAVVLAAEDVNMGRRVMGYFQQYQPQLSATDLIGFRKSPNV